MNRYIQSLAVSLALHIITAGTLAVLVYAVSQQDRQTVTIDFSSISTAQSGTFHGKAGQAASRGSGTAKQANHPDSRMQTARRQPASRSSQPLAEKTVSTQQVKKQGTQPAGTSQHATSVSRSTIGSATDDDNRNITSKNGPEVSDGTNGTSTGTGAPGSGNAFGQGNGTGDDTGALRHYVRQHYHYIVRRIRQYLVYPEQARRMGITGTVTCEFIIMKDGSIRSLRVRNSSTYPALDEAAQKAIERANPFPAPPAPAKIIVPVTFSLK